MAETCSKYPDRFAFTYPFKERNTIFFNENSCRHFVCVPDIPANNQRLKRFWLGREFVCIKISAKIDRSGVIHVVYVLNNGSLTYLSKEASSSWSLPATISTESSSYVSLAVDGNNVPGVAYQTSGGLKFAKLQASVWNVELVTAEAGDYVSFSFDQSNEPNISYRSIPVNDLKCAKKTGSSWEIETVESAGDCGGWSSITFDINGFPHICYIKDSLYVKHAWKTTSTWETESVVFGEALDSWFIGSLKPKICYMDNGTLKFAEYK